MTEELHKITYSPTFTDQLTRDDIEYTAALEPFENLGPAMQAKVLACREWLAANPKRGLTRDEFDKLPDGTIIATALGNQYILAGGRGYYTTNDRPTQTVRWVEFGDDDLANVTVVSTPAPPPARQIGGEA